MGPADGAGLRPGPGLRGVPAADVEPVRRLARPAPARGVRLPRPGPRRPDLRHRGSRPSADDDPADAEVDTGTADRRWPDDRPRAAHRWTMGRRRIRRAARGSDGRCVDREACRLAATRRARSTSAAHSSSSSRPASAGGGLPGQAVGARDQVGVDGLAGEVPDHRAQLGLLVEREPVVDRPHPVVVARQAVAALAVGAVGQQVEAADGAQHAVARRVLEQGEVVARPRRRARTAAASPPRTAGRRRAQDGLGHDVPAQPGRQLVGRHLPPVEPGREVPQRPLAPPGLVHGPQAAAVGLTSTSSVAFELHGMRPSTSTSPDRRTSSAAGPSSGGSVHPRACVPVGVDRQAAEPAVGPALGHEVEGEAAERLGLGQA